MNSFGSSEGSMPYNSGKNTGDIDLSLKCRNTRKGDSKALSFKLQKAKKDLKFGKLQKQSSKKSDGKHNPQNFVSSCRMVNIMHTNAGQKVKRTILFPTSKKYGKRRHCTQKLGTCHATSESRSDLVKRATRSPKNEKTLAF